MLAGMATPKSMGEETVQSSREGGVSSVEPESEMEVSSDSKRRGAGESGTMSVAVTAGASGVEVHTMSVTGRMAADGAAGSTVSMTGGVDVPSEGKLSESVGGGGEGGGEMLTIGGVGGRGDNSLIQGEVESDGGGWESVAGGGEGESLVGGGDVDSSSIFNWMGMSECVMTGGGGSGETGQSV